MHSGNAEVSIKGEMDWRKFRLFWADLLAFLLPSKRWCIPNLVEADMSKFHSPDGERIPMGILVEAAKKPNRNQKTSPGRKPEKSDRQIPWLYIAVGGSAAWVVIILVVAVLTMSQENVGKPEPRAPKPLAVDDAIEVPLAQAPKPVIKPDIVEDEVPLLLPAPNPRLLRPEGDDRIEGPPEIDIPPVDFKRRPDVAPAVPDAPKPAKKIVDLNVFQNCQDIGTDVLFMRNPVEAFKRAKEEKKMVFMVHLSGNLEDPDFT